jgi:hypothetical protein
LTSDDSKTTGSVPDVCTGKEAQCEVSAAICACDIKMFSVAYVGGFIAKQLLNNSICKEV